MGCLLAGLAVLLAFAVPASIARSSLIGAYIVIGLLAVLAVAGVVWNARRRTAGGAVPRRSLALTQVAVLTVGYVVVVTVIHATA